MARLRLESLAHRLVAVVIILVAVLGVSIASAVTIHASGASIPQTILSTGTPTQPSWISSFQTLTNNQVTIIYNATGSSTGDNLILSGQVDMAISETQGLQSTILHIPITLTALEFPYNIPASQIMGPLNLTADIVARMFSGLITNWTDPAILQANPLLSYVGPINLVVRSEGAGSTYVVSQYLSTSSSYWALGTSQVINWPSGVMYAHGSSGVAAAINASVGTIGYTRWGVAATFGLPAGMLKNSAGYWTKPTQESVLAACLDFSPDFGGYGLPAAGESWAAVSLVNQAGHSTYPVVTFSYALVIQNMMEMADRGAAVANFLKYINLASTQATAPSFSFVPLPSFVLQENDKAMQTIELGYGYSFFDYYNPHVPKGGNRTAGILSLVLALLLVMGLFGLIIKEIHYRYGQDRLRGVY